MYATRVQRWQPSKPVLWQREEHANSELIQFDRRLYKPAPFFELSLPQTSVCSGETLHRNGVEHIEPPWMER
jgi:hypothetical protein